MPAYLRAKRVVRIRRKVLSLIGGSVLCCLAGCSQHALAPSVSKPDATLNWSMPDLSYTTAYILPEGGPYGRRGVPSASVRLPKGLNTGESAFVFISKDNAFLSVFPDVYGPSQRKRYALLQNSPPAKGLVTAGPWIGECASREVRGDVRMGEECSMYSDAGYYSFMVSWPEQSPKAKSEAETMARDVIWSYEALRAVNR